MAPASAAAVGALARSYQRLSEEITHPDIDIAALAPAAAPALLALHGIGPEVAGQLIVSAGTILTGCTAKRLRPPVRVAPIPANSGRTDRRRLNRGGDRAANHALRTIVLSRLRYDPRTRAYAARRTAQGLGKKEIIRCLERCVARDVHRAIRTPSTQGNKNALVVRQSAGASHARER